MSALIKGYLEEAKGNPAIPAIVAGLQHYMNVSPDVRGIEEKFIQADRIDHLEEALVLKERAYQKIMRYQFSSNAQEIFAFLLAELHTNFQQIVWPAVLDGAGRSQIDELVLTKVLEPALQRLEQNPLKVFKDEIRGLLFFLTGNCWIAWKK